MDQLIKQEIVDIINQIQRKDAPICTADEGEPVMTDVSEHRFDIVDYNSNPAIVVEPNTGTAHYINGNPDETYLLRIICYDEYLHRFTFDDGKGNAQKSRLKDGTKMADYIVYNLGERKVYFLVHEISDKIAASKIRIARKQLSDTLNVLFKSKNIAAFIEDFEHKICFLSAKDDRRIVETHGLADGFINIYKVLPEPMKFNFGQIGTHKFQAYETSIVKLEK